MKHFFLKVTSSLPVDLWVCCPFTITFGDQSATESNMAPCFSWTSPVFLVSLFLHISDNLFHVSSLPHQTNFLEDPHQVFFKIWDRSPVPFGMYWASSGVSATKSYLGFASSDINGVESVMWKHLSIHHWYTFLNLPLPFFSPFLPPFFLSPISAGCKSTLYSSLIFSPFMIFLSYAHSYRLLFYWPCHTLRVEINTLDCGAIFWVLSHSLLDDFLDITDSSRVTLRGVSVSCILFLNSWHTPFGFSCLIWDTWISPTRILFPQYHKLRRV